MEIKFGSVLFREVLLIVRPLISFETPGDLLDRFRFWGWDLEVIYGNSTLQLVSDLADKGGSIVALVTNLLDNPPEDFAAIKEGLGELGSLISEIDDLFSNNQSASPSVSIGDLFGDVFGKLLVQYLADFYPAVCSVLWLADIIRHPNVAPLDDGDTEYRTVSAMAGFDYEKFKSFIKNPKEYLNDLFFGQLGSIAAAAVSGNHFFNKLAPLLSDFGIVSIISNERDKPLPAAPTADDYHRYGTLRSFYPIKVDGQSVAIGAALRLLSEVEGGKGLLIFPFGSVDLQFLLAGYDVKIQVSADIASLAVTGDSIDFGTSTGPGNGLTVECLVRPNAATPPQYIIGAAAGTHLNITKPYFRLEADFVPQSLIFDGAFVLPQSNIVIKPGDGDGFLKKVLPQEGLRIDFELIVGYDYQRGLYVRGGAGLEVLIPVHLKILFIEIDSVYFGLSVSTDGSLKIIASASLGLNFGPLIVNAQRLGMKSILEYSTSQPGNLGNLNFDIDFKFPDGVGLEIDAPPVKGGGFLNFDASSHTYTGGVELKFSKISFAAIGVLTTRLPGGEEGYSLLIVITAKFTPIQLGFGFTLNGLGGLLGLHRTMNADRLRAGLKDRTLDNILFPEDIVDNAASIISTIGEAFPIAKDRFLIGPMAKIGWGTPTLITIDLGIIIELPSPVLLAILGVIKAILPDEKKPVVRLQINFLGIIDFDKKQLSFDATLYDSKILTFGLFGDMALRLYWGDKPNFLMSVGGFHPKYTPPPMNLPQMQRLSIVLVDEEEVSVIVATYFAVTSNSVQFGARVDAKASALGYDAVGALYFDILFKFSPFYFLAEMGAMFSVRKGSKELLTLYIDMSLEGPNPWRAQGKGTFKVLMINVEVSFDKTFGQVRTEAVEAAEIWPKLEEAIKHKDNWEVNGPDRSHQLLSFREVQLTTETILVDPFGSVSFNQKVVPLNTTLSKFGTSGIKDFKKFSITSVAAAGTPAPPVATAQTREFFAPADYFYLSDDQKLSREAFEKYESGVEIGPSAQIRSGYVVSRDVEYEKIVIDTRYRNKFVNPIALDTAEQQMHNLGNYIESSGLSTSGNGAPQGGPDKVFVLSTDDYYIVDRNTMQPVLGSPNSFLNFSHAAVELNALQQLQPSNAADYLIVNAYEL